MQKGREDRRKEGRKGRKQEDGRTEQNRRKKGNSNRPGRHPLSYHHFWAGLGPLPVSPASCLSPRLPLCVVCCSCRTGPARLTPVTACVCCLGRCSPLQCHRCSPLRCQRCCPLQCHRCYPIPCHHCPKTLSHTTSLPLPAFLPPPLFFRRWNSEGVFCTSLFSQ